MSRRGRQTLLVLHYVCSVGWLGGGIGQLTLNLTALTTADPALRHAAHEIAHVFDLSMLTALSLGSAVTGILLGLRGTWGLVRYWWVAGKLVVTVALIVLIPSLVGGWIRAAIEDTSGGPAGAGYPPVRNELLAASIVIVTVLVLVTAVSVVKPWGRTPWEERRRRRPRVPYRSERSPKRHRLS